MAELKTIQPKISEERIGKESRKKIRIGFYPYTYVRSTVMRTMLLKKQDYDKLLKMDFNEIAEFLQETTYRQEIDRYAATLHGAELIEKALNANLASSFQKLLRISSDELRILIREYLKKNDLNDIKTILRGVLTKTDKEKILGAITGAGALSYDYYAELLNNGSNASIDGILRSFVVASGFENHQELLQRLRGKNLAEIENILDHCYYRELFNLSRRVSKQGHLFRDFLIEELTVLNLLAILRLKRINIGAKEIERYVFDLGDKNFGDKNYGKIMKELARAEGIAGAEKILEKTKYREIVKAGIESYKKNNSLIELETNLYKHLLSKAMMFAHQYPLSIDVILGYMFAKDIEVRNLRMLVKGKQLGVSNEFLAKQLVG